MDVTFWVIQAVLLAPVLFMAASVGKEVHADASLPRETPVALEPVSSAGTRVRVRRRGHTTAAGGGLGVFSVEQQARLVVLRYMVQEARRGRGALSDDMLAEDDPRPVPKTRPVPQRASRARRLGLKRHVLLAGGALLIGLVGIAGVVRTSDAIDRLQLTSESRLARVSPISQLLPGAIANPGKYLAALNGSAIPTNLGGTASDPLFATGFLSDKQAMDRWEAVVAVGLSLLLFVNAAHAAPTASASSADSGSYRNSGSVASDLAPFILVAAVLFAALSFFEIP